MSSNGCESRFQVLCYEQVHRLNKVMEETIPIHGRGNFPTLQVRLKDLVKTVKESLNAEGIPVKDVRMNGGAASYVVDTDIDHSAFNDLDLIFQVKIASPSDLQKIKDAALDSLLQFLPEGVNRDKMSSCCLKEAYVRKMVKIYNDSDRWSLISLANVRGRNVELKFVDSMKRQFEFSVDSFQIVLNSLFTFDHVSQTPMNENFYPTIVAESVYGDFYRALYHLTHKLIATRNPEEIRGGGLLKYCHLLVRGFKVSYEMDQNLLERYMCSRFFIDFSDVSVQKPKLESYLQNHFNDDSDLKFNYLMALYNVVDNSTICLMGHERRQTLMLIQHFAYQAQFEQDCRARKKYLEMQFFDQQNSLVVDQVYFGVPYGQQYYVSPYQNSNSYSPYIQCT